MTMADQPIAPVSSDIAAFVGVAPSGPIEEAQVITSFAHFTAVFGGLWPENHLGYSVRDFFRHGGQTAVVLRVDPSGGSTTALTSGLRALEHRAATEPAADPVGLLVVPPVTADGAGWVDPEHAVLHEAVAVATGLGAVALLDAPAGWTSAAAALSGIRDVEALRSPNAAVYFPRIVVTDPVAGGPPRSFGPAGAVAGIIARTDAREGVWKAPAGERASLDVASLSTTLTSADRSVLNPLGVNCLVPTSEGILVWGARTFVEPGASDWTYLPVRRLALLLEHSVCRGLRWVATEPSTEALWKRIRDLVETYLHDLHRQGAFAGAAARDAWFVRCDASTMSRSDVAAGVVRLHLGFAPLRPAEYVVLQIRLDAVPS